MCRDRHHAPSGAAKDGTNKFEDWPVKSSVRIAAHSPGAPSESAHIQTPFNFVEHSESMASLVSRQGDPMKKSVGGALLIGAILLSVSSAPLFSQTAATEKSLYDRLGGKKAITAVV